MRSARGTFVVLLVALLVGACGADPYGRATVTSPSPSPSGGAQPDVVDVTGFVFTPASMTVRQGTTLRYVNGDRAAHTVTHGTDGRAAPAAAFDAHLPIEGTAEVTFAVPGEILVTCTLHPAMNQLVVVTTDRGP